MNDRTIEMRQGGARRRDLPGLVVFVAAAALLWWASHDHPSAMPAIAPWDFSVLWFAAFWFSLWWYARGAARTRPPVWRTVLFGLGMASIWGVLQTHFEYLAQHMFFLNRIQHLVMHHLGPFLIAIAWPWETLLAGMPPSVRRLCRHRRVERVLALFRMPEVAAGLFVGLIALWLYPPVHFVAMIDPRLYQLMNWSMVVDGLLFWAVVLDPRGAGEAGNSFGVRAAMAVGIILPQIAMGAIIAFQHEELYVFYGWCGRVIPSIDGLSDEHIGGLLVWIPPAMMSMMALLLVLDAMRREQERTAPTKSEGEGGVSSSGWTGR